ncbi:MAG: hypothetical protein CMP07_10715 [Xanthomonadales bacterium]|nr:hypothetical protein [Xanthomonadales bacterium]
MKPVPLKAISIAAAAGLMLSSLQAQAGPPSRAEILAGQERVQHGYDSRHQQRHHQPSRHRGADYAQHRYDNARRYAANAVRQAREAHRLGYYPDHPRWSADFQRHLEWALGVDAWKLEREARKRALKLRELRRYAHHGYGVPH